MNVIAASLSRLPTSPHDTSYHIMKNINENKLLLVVIVPAFFGGILGNVPTLFRRERISAGATSFQAALAT